MTVEHAAAIATVRPPARERRRLRRRQRFRHYGTVAVLMSPWVIGFCAFIALPLGMSLYYSFTSYNLLSSPRWVGVANYDFMFTQDPFYWSAVKNTLWMIAFGVPLRILVAMGAAILLTHAQKSSNVYRTLFFMPSMTPIVGATLIFVYLFNPATGPINRLLDLIQLPGPLWFYDPVWAKPALLFVALWGVGDAIVIFLAGLLQVPRQLYEAVEIEGASAWQRFRYVTLPMLSPVILFSLIIGVIEGFQYFSQGYVASTTTGNNSTLGEPQGSTLFYALWLYNQAFRFFHMGYASAMAWVLFMATLFFTLLLIWSSKRWVFYAGAQR